MQHHVPIIAFLVTLAVVGTGCTGSGRKPVVVADPEPATAGTQQGGQPQDTGVLPGQGSSDPGSGPGAGVPPGGQGGNSGGSQGGNPPGGSGGGNGGDIGVGLPDDNSNAGGVNTGNSNSNQPPPADGTGGSGGTGGTDTSGDTTATVTLSQVDLNNAINGGGGGGDGNGSNGTVDASINVSLDSSGGSQPSQPPAQPTQPVRPTTTGTDANVNVTVDGTGTLIKLNDMNVKAPTGYSLTQKAAAEDTVLASFTSNTAWVMIYSRPAGTASMQSIFTSAGATVISPEASKKIGNNDWKIIEISKKVISGPHAGTWFVTGFFMEKAGYVYYGFGQATDAETARAAALKFLESAS